MKNIIKFVFSGEFIFAAFLLSSVFKSALDNIIPFDVTIIFMGLSGLIALKRIIQKNGIPKNMILPLVLFYLFGAFILFSNIYSTSDSYAMDKTIRFLLLTGWSFVGIFILVPNKNSLSKFFKSILLITVMTSFYVMYQYFTSLDVILGYTRFGVDGDNVIGLARISGLAALIALMFYIYSKTSFKVKVFGILLISLFVTTLLLTGSRMPFLSLLISAAISLVLSLKIDKNSFKINRGGLVIASFVPIIPIGLIPFYDSGFMQTTIQRVTSLFQYDASTIERVVRMQSANDMFVDNPIFGNGIGSYALYFGNTDERSYPHNIFLEVLSELGFIGIALFLLLFIYAMFKFIKELKLGLSVEQITVVITFVYLLINANVSGDINDNRILYSFLALVIIIDKFKKEYQVEHSDIKII